LFTLLDAIRRYDDTRFVRPLLLLGTGRRVIDTVARFGAHSVQQIAEFVDSGDSVMPGPGDGSIVDYLQGKARSLLAGQ
jgi:hypothetical protein